MNCVICNKKIICLNNNNSKKYCDDCKKKVTKESYKRSYEKNKRLNRKDICLICNSKYKLEKHHIIQIVNNTDEFTINLCFKCHKQIHKYYKILTYFGYKIVHK